VLGVAVAVVAALLISFLTIDLGRIPGLKQAAEGYASRWIDRPLHIGKLEVRPARGEYVISDLVIDGLPGERPFFTAKTIYVSMSWRTVWQRQLAFDVRLYDWQMLIEKWSDPDRHNIPRLTGPPKDPNKPDTKGPFTFRTRSQAQRGTFIYEDHGTPWSVIAPNLSFDMAWSMFEKKYVGLAKFTKGTVRIQDFLPMSAEMTTRFALDGAEVTLPHIDLKTDGADTHVTGHLSFKRWPEQSYTLNSTIDFARMREIFFARETWKIGGQGHFAGVFNIYKDARGRNLSGDFTSDLATVDAFRFPNLHGSLVWLRDRFAVTHADADFCGGDTRFAYAIEPLGTPGGATQKFAADLERVDLRQLNQLFNLHGFELDGRARGRVAMAWPSGHLRQGVAGYGEVTAVPPDGVRLATATLATPLAFRGAAATSEFNPKQPLGPLPVGGDLAFRFDPEGVTFSESTVATPSTFVALKGRYDGKANFPFHVTSRDWQASDRLLAAIMTARGTPSDPVEVGGVGTFDGVMTETFDAPRVQGHFIADDMAAWKVVWGHGEGDVVIQDKYLDVTKGLMRRDSGTIRADGRFALGFPRADHGEEIRARISVRSWPLDDLRVAFNKNKEDWPIEGLIASSDLELHGLYGNDGLFGSGPMRLEHGKAWTEPFEVATGDLAFNGPTVDLTNMRIAKGTGALTGKGRVGWNKSYSFDAAGERIAVESLDFFKIERVPLTGVLSLNASGQGTFDAPYYRVHADAPDLSAGDQVIGHTRADITVENGTLTIDRLDAESNRLRAFSQGQVKLNDQYDTVFTARFEDASIDPYLKFITTNRKWSDFVHAVVFGEAKATGPLKDVARMQLEATINQGTLSLWDYELKNDGPIDFTIKDKKLAIGQFKLQGKDTKVALLGTMSMADSTADLRIVGDVNLAILDGPPDRTSSGNAKLDANIRGAFDSPVMSGTAEIKDGEFRYGILPRLTDITGTLTFDHNAINADGLRAKMGGGDVTFGGNVTLRLDEYRFDEYNLSATGQRMTVRYPEGFQSTVDATLSLTGPVRTPLLSGDIKVLKADYIKRIDPDVVALLGLAAAGGGAGAGEEFGLVQSPGQSLSYDINIHALPSTLRIDNKAGTHIEGGGDLHYSGPADRPSLIGMVDLNSGAVAWNGNRYVLRSGSIEFNNPNKIEPYFSAFAVTRPRAPGQTFEVSVSLAGTTSKLGLTLSADPWLSEYDIIRLLLGEAPGKEAAELRARNQSQELPSVMQSAAAQLLAAPISSRVGSAISALPGAPTVSISPVLADELNSATTARVTVGKQISSKAYIVYTRRLGIAGQNEFILLEYEESERLSWILSRNENQSFALEFRIRHVF
jgi:hypothetical protein